MVVSGTINAIDATTRIANITHGPMTDIGMPGMTMDFAVDADVPLEDLPLETELQLLFNKNPDFSLTLIGKEKAMNQ